MPADKQEPDAAFKLTHLASHISHSETDVGSGTRPSGGRGSEVPKTFGKYRLIRLLGEGGMGAVYLARDTELERDVALKLPKIKGTKSGEVLDRFRREARTAATLNHPNVCPMYEFGELDGQFFLTMAYVDGEPLSYYTKKTKAIAARQVALLIRKLAMALAHAHAKGIIHRDLKPGNVMINKKAQPIVMDFGLARRDASEDTRLTQTGAFVGTPAYVSPEQITNRKGEVDHRTDIYSLGVMLYEMLAQRLPYEAENAMNMMAQVLTGTPDPPTVHRDRACPRLSEIAMKAITRDVTQRYQTMKEVADDLTAYLKGDTAPRADLSESAARTAAGFGDEVYQTAALDAENIDFLNFDLKDYGLGETVSPRSKTAAGNRDSRTSTRGSQTSSSSTASAGSSARRSRLATAQRRSDNSGNKSLLLRLGGIAAVAAIALGIFLTIRTKYGSVVLEITGNPNDVQISVDGETISLDVAEKGYTIDVGEHSMTVKADGFETETRKFSVNKNQVSVEVVQLKRIKDSDSGGSTSPGAPQLTPTQTIELTTSDRAFLAMIDPQSDWKWLPPELLGVAIETDKLEMTPAISADGLTLMFFSEGIGPPGAFVSRRVTLNAPWADPTRVNAPIFIWSFYLNSNGTGIITCGNDGKSGGAGLWTTTLDKSTNDWQPPEKLKISGNKFGQYPYVSPDGTELYFASNDGSNFCTRTTASEDWSKPVRLQDHSTALNDVAFESVSFISDDGRAALLFPDPIVVFRESKGKPWQNPQRVADFPRMFPASYSPAAGLMVFDYRRSTQPDLGIMRLVPRNSVANGAARKPAKQHE